MNLSPRGGTILIVLACSLIAMTTVLAKQLGTGPDALSPFKISWGHYTFALGILLFYFVARRPTVRNMKLPLNGVRAAFGFKGVTCMFALGWGLPCAGRAKASGRAY